MLVKPIRPRAGQRGATTVELIYVLPLFFVLTFAIVEAAFVFRMRYTLNVASFHAARTGSLQHALLNPMRQKLAEGMAPHLMAGDRSLTGHASAVARANIMATALRAVRDPVTVLSPPRSAMNAFGETRRMRIPGDNFMRDRRVIPNDNLRYRNPANRTLEAGGESVELNIQDANLLKISTYWCYRLKTPVLDRIVNGIVSGLLASPEQRACDLVGAADANAFYLAVTGQAIVRMQSEIVLHDNNLP